MLCLAVVCYILSSPNGLSLQSVLAVSLATHHNPCKGVGIVLPIDIACWQRTGKPGIGESEKMPTFATKPIEPMKLLQDYASILSGLLKDQRLLAEERYRLMHFVVKQQVESCLCF